VVYRLPKHAAPEHRDRLVHELCGVGVPVTAPSTRPLNRVLRAIPRPVDALNSNVLLRRLESFAASAPPDDRLAHSTRQHDRMISFPARLLYGADAKVARSMALAARPVVERAMSELAP